MRYIQTVLAVCFLIVSIVTPVYSLNETDCLFKLNSGEYGNSTESYAMNNTGQYVGRNDPTATAIPYFICMDKCGGEAESFNWSVFSKQFASWLLPYLALISQLPWGAEYRLDNILSMVLNVGSPMLAAHSLVLTVLNGHYVAKRFSHISYPNKNNAVRVLAGLQQSPLRVSNLDEGLLASLIVLPQNDKWWIRMTKLMNYEHTWSIPAIASIAWVVVAYFFTVADSFSEVPTTFHANGQGVGCLWLWLIPVVVGWLQVSPKCDHERLKEALEQSNEIAYVATADFKTPILASSPGSGVVTQRAFTFLTSSIFPDELCTSPIFNYARMFSWSHCVEEVAEAFEHAAEKAESKHPVSRDSSWAHHDEIELGTVVSHNRHGSLEEVIEYCSPEPYDLHRSRLPHGVSERFLLASFVAFLLQWGTGGGAIYVNWVTPTTGLGCRAMSSLVYCLASTVVWVLIISSSVFAYISTNRLTLKYDRKNASTFQRCSASLSVFLRRLGTVLAALNTLGIVAICILLFTNFFNSCKCNSSVWSRGYGEHAYMVVRLLDGDVQGIKAGWGAGVAISTAACFLFTGFIQIYLEPQVISD